MNQQQTYYQDPVDCTNCGGDGHTGFEEDTGRPYSCYRCGETGWQRVSQLEDHELAVEGELGNVAARNELFVRSVEKIAARREPSDEGRARAARFFPNLPPCRMTDDAMREHCLTHFMGWPSSSLRLQQQAVLLADYGVAPGQEPQI